MVYPAQMADVKRRRRYVSPKREAQARQTRQEIAAAAGQLFGEAGYAATTIEAVAEEAGVATQTVYATFGSKRSLLWTVLEEAVAGDDTPRPLIDRFRDALADADGKDERLERVVAITANTLDRSADAHRALRGAATSDPDLKELLERSEAGRYQDVLAVTSLILGGGAAAQGEDRTRIADIVFAVTSPEVYDLLVVARGWSLDQYRAWLQATLWQVFHAEDDPD